MKRLILFLTIISLLMVCGTAIAETGQKAIEEIRLSIEKSAFSKETKTSLLKKVNDAVNAGIQPGDVVIIVNRGMRQNLDGKAIEGFIGIAVKVKNQNLPVRPVLDRMQQGLSKGVPADRIMGVTGMLAEKLSVANTIVNDLIKSGVKAGSGKAKEETIQTVALALERSIPENIITQTGMRVKKHNHPISMFEISIDTMTNLVGSGMRVEQASKLVNKAMDRGYSEKDILRMEREIFSEIKEGKRMEDAARRMESVMERGGFERSHRGMEGGQMRGTSSGMESGSSMGGSDSKSGPGWGGGSGMQRR